ncbi:MAG: OPT/YSL family transporter [candidate division Zixibacteria bacterium]|nr:OPT/YSL family transporter [Candidatus Tariuqbacter arcticus]
MGLAFTFHFWYALSMFVGGLIAHILDKRASKFSEKYTIPFASGLIAGESLLGILVAWLAVQGVI